MPFWAVHLLGDSLDLQDAQRVLSPGYDPWIERAGPENERFILRSAAFDTMTAADDVREAGLRLLQQLNGAVRLMTESGELTLGAVLKVEDDGSIHPHVHGSLHSSVRMSLSATGRVGDGQPGPPQQPFASALIQAAESDDDIADLLGFLGRADNWYDIYKATEAICAVADVGLHDLVRQLGASGSEFRHMREYANTHRHHRVNRQPAPISLGRARSILMWSARDVLERKLGRR